MIYTPNSHEWMQSVAAIIAVPHRAERPFTLGEAVAELGIWARDARDDAWAFAGNRVSLDNDIAGLVTFIGPEVLAIVSDLLPQLSTANDRVVVSQAANDFTARWTQPATIGAAFRDLCAFARSADPTMTALEPRARIVASQLGEASRGFGVLSEISNLLSAEPDDWQVERIRAQDERFVEDSPSSRLAAAERLLEEEPASGEVVVWCLYRRARIPWRTSAGPITFLRAASAIQYATGEEDGIFPEQDELRHLLEESVGFDAERILEHEESGESHVLVRVDMGARSPLGAAVDAHQRIDALLNIAAGAGGVSWVSTGTSAILLDGDIAGGNLGTNYARQTPFADNYGMGATSELVESWSKQLEASLLKGPMPGPLMEALGAVKEARLTDHRDVHFYDARPVTPRVATALEDHALEQIATLAQLKPEKLMNELVAEEAARAWDRWVAGAIAAPLNHREETTEQHREREAVERAICRHTSYGTRVVDLGKAWDARDALRKLARDPAVRADLEEALLAISSPAEEQRSRERVLADTELVRRRHRRIRNAVAHGNPASPAGIGSIRDYSDSVASDALSLALQSYASSRDISAVIADRVRARARDHPKRGSLRNRLATARAASTEEATSASA